MSQIKTIVSQFRTAAQQARERARKTGRKCRINSSTGALVFHENGRFFGFKDKREKSGLGVLSQEVCLQVAKDTGAIGYFEYDGRYFEVHKGTTLEELDQRMIQGKSNRQYESRYRTFFPEAFK